MSSSNVARAVWLVVLAACSAPVDPTEVGSAPQAAECRTREDPGTPPQLTDGELDACAMLDLDELTRQLTEMDQKRFACRQAANRALQQSLTDYVNGGETCNEVIPRWRLAMDCIEALQSSRGLTPEQHARVGGLLVTLPDRCSGTFSSLTTCPESYRQTGVTHDVSCTYDGTARTAIRNFVDGEQIASADCERIAGDGTGDDDVYRCTCGYNPVVSVECWFHGTVDNDLYRVGCGANANAPDAWRNELAFDCSTTTRLTFETGGVLTQTFDIDVDTPGFGAARRGNFVRACDIHAPKDHDYYEKLCNESAENPASGPRRYLLDVPCCEFVR